MMTQKMEVFKRALVEAVDEGLLMLGENGREVIYYRLKHSYALKKEDIPGCPEIFVKCLRSIFGDGAEAIERAIIKSLYNKLGMEFHAKKDSGFLEYLNEAKKAFEERLEL